MQIYTDPDKVYRTAGRVLSILLFILWGSVFLNQLSWFFMARTDISPVQMWFGQISHFLFTCRISGLVKVGTDWKSSCRCKRPFLLWECSRKKCTTSHRCEHLPCDVKCVLPDEAQAFERTTAIRESLILNSH